MRNRIGSKIITVVFIYFAFFLTATIFESDFWGNILSPAGALLSAGIIFRSYLNSRKADFRRHIWLSFCLACLSWAFADIVWVIDDLILGIDPEQSQLVLMGYFLTSVFLAVGILIYTIHSIRKWNAIQIFVDAAAISFSIILLLWVLLFDKDLNNLGMVNKDGWYSTASLIIDLIILISITVWYIVLRGKELNKVLRIMIMSILLYAVSDIIYYYLYLKNLYMPNSLIDALYIASLLGIAIGVSLVPATYYMHDEINDLSGKFISISDARNVLILFPAPILIILYEGFNMADLFVCGLIITAHASISYFIKSSVLKEQMLIHEKRINLDLEKKIEERTRELIEKNAQLDFLSNRDTVTNISNRRYFLQELDKSVNTLKRDETLTLAFIDLDRFKTINDVYGHYIGDNILIELAKRLMMFSNSDTLIARLGGDEFVVAFGGKYSHESAGETLRQIIKKCSEPIQVQAYSFEVTMSVGVSMYPFDADSTDSLLRNADIAMYQAKREGNNKIVVFNDILKLKNRQRNKIEIGLKTADFDKEFFLCFQPQFTIPDKKLTGMEALLRWNCPGLGLVSPSEFIPIAEEINWIVPIGEWVMTRAASQIAQWNREYDMNLKMAVNVSPKQLAQTDFSRRLLSVLALEGIPPEWIDVEITEGVALEGNNKINALIEEFREHGITVSIDDFGTGYASLSYLKMFPFHRVKIAMQLIDNITFDRYDLQIVRSILLLAESIGIKCIAEGVETQEQFDLLHGLGCKEMQGYLLGKPVPAREFEENFLKSRLRAVFEDSYSG